MSRRGWNRASRGVCVFVFVLAFVFVVAASAGCRGRTSGTGAGTGAGTGTGTGTRTGAGTGTGTAAGMDAAAWREDLRALADELPRRHVDPWFHVTEAAFRAAVADVDAHLDAMDDAHAQVALARLVAMIGDGHTALATPLGLMDLRYPLQLYVFDDGVFVTDAADPTLVGGRVVAIDGHAIDDVVAALTPTISHDNAGQLKGQLPWRLIAPDTLAGVGVAASRWRATYRIEVGGQARDVALDATRPRPPPPVAADAPLARQKHQYPYWNTWVEADHMVYLQYNACVDAPGQPFADFAAATLAFADGHPVERFVIDLRFNGGGNSELIRPLLDGLIARPALARGLYVIIGRDTFSSAVLDAILLARAGAVLVGEPSGGRPSHHGEVQTFTLPRSHLRVSYSTKYFDNPDFPGDAIEPAIAVPQRAADWFAGRDPALDAIRAAAR